MGWRYRPYLLNGEPREVQSTILLQFFGGVGKRPPVVSGTARVAGIAGMTGGVAGNVGDASTGGAVRVSPGVVAGLLEAPVAPIYPPIAKAAHVQGVVVLHAILSKTGDVEDLQLISGPPMLVAAAMDAVRRWQYRPYLLNGEPIEVDTTINVNFTLAEPKKVDADAAGNPETAGDAPVRVSSGTMAQLALERPMPMCSVPTEPYPSGVVVLYAIISKEGAVKDVQVVVAAKSLQECSLAAVRQWHYKPYLVDGVPKEVETIITIDMSFGGRTSTEGAK
jgi:TonB family protein